MIKRKKKAPILSALHVIFKEPLDDEDGFEKDLRSKMIDQFYIAAEFDFLQMGDRNGCLFVRSCDSGFYCQDEFVAFSYFKFFR